MTDEQTTPDETPDETPATGQPTLQDVIREEIAKAMSDLQGDGTADEGPAIPHVPKVDHRPETPEEVSALAGMLAAFRKEIHDLRTELRQRSGQQVQIAGPTETVEERTNKRLELIAQHSHYCPACGNLGSYPQKCSGLPGSVGGHDPIEMVSTDELGGDPDNHTKAPSTDPTALPVLAA